MINKNVHVHYSPIDISYEMEEDRGTYLLKFVVLVDKNVLYSSFVHFKSIYTPFPFLIEIDISLRHIGERIWRKLPPMGKEVCISGQKKKISLGKIDVITVCQ